MSFDIDPKHAIDCDVQPGGRGRGACDCDGIPYGTPELRVYIFKAWAKAVGLGLLCGTVLCVLLLVIASIAQAL